MRKSFACFIIAACSYPAVIYASCDKSSVASTPTSRFVLKDGEAYDTKTSLTWSRCSAGTTWQKEGRCTGEIKLMQWGEAKKYAKKMGNAWRLPTIEELYSIVESKCSNPAVNATVFPNIRDQGEGAPYWSATEVKGISPLVYHVDFFSGEIDGRSSGFALGVRLVRSGK
ncbi:Lcl C-terminal domain-containing protein [Chitinimonas sp. PSY-7]|uniref:Lcl domain-containing protein n=1 Tax=Chitinimonas sp. PSY-7 TaxID=3459088 RepID=UPI004040144D